MKKQTPREKRIELMKEKGYLEMTPSQREEQLSKGLDELKQVFTEKQVQIIGLASPICWWKDCLGQISPVLEVYEPTGFIKIRVTEKGFEPYEQEGWIDTKYVEFV